MFGKLLSELTQRDIEEFIEQKMTEGRDLEYKSQLLDFPSAGLSGDKEPHLQKKEFDFLKAVSSFANSDGGVLLFGIKAKSGRPESINGIKAESSDAIKLKLENKIKSGLDPRLNISDYEISPVLLGDGTYVVVIEIQKSWIAPHRISVDESSKFYGRNSSGAYLMDTDQIKSSILFSESVVQKIKDFREERIKQIEYQFSSRGLMEDPARIQKGSFVVIHTIPINAIKNAQCNWKLASERGNELPLFHISSLIRNEKYNLNGYVRLNNISGGENESYTQLYRNGITETFDGQLLKSIPKIGIMENVINGPMFFMDVLRHLNSIFKLYKKMSIQCPVYVFLTMLNIEGFRLDPNGNQFVHGISNEVKVKDIFYPEMIVSDYPKEDDEEDFRKITKELMDQVWNTWGYPECGREPKQK